LSAMNHEGSAFPGKKEQAWGGAAYEGGEWGTAFKRRQATGVKKNNTA